MISSFFLLLFILYAVFSTLCFQLEPHRQRHRPPSYSYSFLFFAFVPGDSSSFSLSPGIFICYSSSLFPLTQTSQSCNWIPGVVRLSRLPDYTPSNGGIVAHMLSRVLNFTSPQHACNACR